MMHSATYVHLGGWCLQSSQHPCEDGWVKRLIAVVPAAQFPKKQLNSAEKEVLQDMLREKY